MTAEPGSPLVAGKVAFVTGGARGLGRAIVNALASAGAVGAVFDVLTDEQISDLPDGWTFRRGDVTDDNVVRSAIAATVQDLGRLDIVVANAGIVPPWRTTQDLNLEEWRRTFAVNVEGIAITLKNTVPHMMSAGGSIIAMGSLNSWRGHPQQAAYVASKHAVLGLVRATALDLGRYSIRVNALAPGAIATEALVGRVEGRAAQADASAKDMLRAMADETALGRLASEDDVARTCLFLASDLASGITGQFVPVDAGLA